MKNDTIVIKPLTLEIIDHFFSYLDDHISDNGKDNTPLFLPISRNDLGLSKALIASFRDGLSIPIDQLAWRRAFIAINEQNEILGHIDLRSRNQNYTNHRAIMGMGVHRDYRKMGIGNLLINSMVNWVKDETAIERIDLWVLAENEPAIRLYNKLGFQRIGVIKDMFRIDGISHGYIMMTKEIEGDSTK